MRIRVGYELIFRTPAPTVMTAMLFVHPSLSNQLEQPDVLHVEPATNVEAYTDLYGNLCARLITAEGATRLWGDNVIEVREELDEADPTAAQHPVENLPADTLPYLLASRYCEVELLSQIAWDLFAGAPTGWLRVQAICDWVHSHIQFGYHHARATKTAYEAYQEKQGVCRDFTHLAVTLCRCMNIPARYCTGYLGDIRVPPLPDPMDFSAWFEVYLGGRWYAFDARHNERRMGRVLMARGRDAVDVALTTSYGPSQLEKFTVWSDELVTEAQA